MHSATNRMRQTTVSLVFHDSFGCVPILSVHLKQGSPCHRSMARPSKQVKVKSGE